MAVLGMLDETLLLEAGNTTPWHTLRFVMKLPGVLLLSRERRQGYPVSTGYVHIQSGIDAYTSLEFRPGYLDESVIPRLPMMHPITDSL